MKNERAIFLRALMVALLGLAVLFAEAQVVNEDDLRKIELPGNVHQGKDARVLISAWTAGPGCRSGPPR